MRSTWKHETEYIHMQNCPLPSYRYQTPPPPFQSPSPQLPWNEGNVNRYIPSTTDTDVFERPTDTTWEIDVRWGLSKGQNKTTNIGWIFYRCEILFLSGKTLIVRYLTELCNYNKWHIWIKHKVTSSRKTVDANGGHTTILMQHDFHHCTIVFIWMAAMSASTSTTHIKLTAKSDMRGDEFKQFQMQNTWES